MLSDNMDRPSMSRSVERSVEYEYRVLTFARGVSRADIRRSLGEHAEYAHWELARTVVYVGGIRRAWLRRRIIRVQRTA